MADQQTTPSSSRSALTRESNRSSHSRVVGGRWSRQVRRASHSRRSRRRTPPQQTSCAQPGVILELRRSSRLVPRSDYAISERWSYGADVTYETRYDIDSHKGGDTRYPANYKRSSTSLLHERKKQKTISASSSSTTEDCVAYSTRSRTALKTSESACELNYSLSTAPSTSNAQSSTQGESGLLPLDERDYVYSPFSTSTVADLIDSDHSVYSPSTHKGKGKKRKRSSLSNKRSQTSLEDCKKKLKLSESNSSHRPSESCNYPLRNRNNRDSGASTSSLVCNSTDKPTTSYYVATSDNYNVTNSKERGETPPLPKELLETSTTKGQQSAESQLLIVPRDLPYLRQTNARRSIAAATGATLGGCLTRGGSSRQESVKRVVSGDAEQSDMPQPHHSATTKRDKRGKSSLGSCVSSGGASSRSHPQSLTTGAVASTSGSPPATSSVSSMPDNGQEGKAKAKANVAGSSEQAMGGSSSSSEEGEVGRLQALLEARGLPPHLLGALGPRMQHLLHRTVTANSAASKAAALLAGLQATGDEGQQLQAVIEMCQLLVMGNEDTLAGFPVRQVVPALINLLAAEHNFDMMNHACRALTYMLEALPRSSGAVALAVPAFLDKLQAITCMDVAEQSLTALDMLSRRHAKAILQARGVSACLMYLDFFSINAQRAALSITANCCQNLTADEFHLVRDSLQLLANRLTQQDKKSVECVCLAFSRLVDSFQTDPARLQEIATPELLTNLQQLLVVQPALISGPVFITVLRLLWMMCSACPQLAIQLHQRSITDTLLCLLTGSTVQQEHVELLSRSPQELYEITCLIAELLPRLPSDGIFSVDAYLDRPWASNAPDRATAHWQWRDDRGVWRSYSVGESVALEAGAAAGEAEVCLMALGRAYTVDLTAMHQLNEHTGTARPVQRLPVQPLPQPSASADPRVALLKAPALLPSLLGVLLQLYWSSAGPALKATALKAILRAVYHADAPLLSASLNLQLISSHLAGMMASSDPRVVVGSLQLADILMQRLPTQMAHQFRREGVLHQVAQLALNPLKPTPNKNKSPTTPNTSKQSELPSTPASTSSSTLEPNKLSLAFSASGSYVVSTLPTTDANAEANAASSTSSQLHASTSVRSNSPMQLAEMLKRKRAVKRSGGSQTAQRLGRRRDEPAPMAHSHGSTTSVPSVYRNAKGTSSKTSSFLSSLNPTRWGRSPHSHKDSPLAKHQQTTTIAVQNKEKVREWVQWFAKRVEREWSCAELGLEALERLRASAEALSPLLKLTHMQKPLEQLRDAINYQDVSPFELNHSGVLNALLTFLTGRSSECTGDEQTDKPDESTDDGSAFEDRLRMFLHVFADLPLSVDAEWATGTFPAASSSLSALVTKVNACVSHLEQFPVRVHDLPARPSSSALKFFNTHQLMCDLKRHPNCNNLKQWKGGVVRIDPLALVQAIERYLSQRGYAVSRPRDGSSATTHSDDEGASDDEVDDALATPTHPNNDAEHKLEFLIGDVVLPYNMTVYQAVRQFSELNDADTDSETPLANAGIWVQTHTIYYRSVESSEVKSSEAGPSRKGKGQPTKVSSRRKPDLLWNEGIVPIRASPLAEAVRWPKDERDVTDASLPALRLLRALYALARHWPSLYRLPCMPDHRPLLPYADFINQKLAAKASRQLQDPLVIMTGNLPPWLKSIAYACPFVFPFECRHLLFYVVSFDRDRALQRLLESGGGSPSSSSDSDRVAPRLDRRKRTVQRCNVLRQAESVMHEFAHSKALLEIQYENEVGTGLGPTLEFYALVSQELQRADLDLWHGSENFKQKPSSFGHEIVKGSAQAQDRLASSVRDALSLEDRPEGSALVQWPCGLFPQAVGRNARAPLVSRLKAKFRFLGKLMAKAVMDSRMLDVPLSLSMYRWALGESQWLSLADVRHVAPELWRSLCRLRPVADAADRIANDDRLTAEQRTTMINALELDGCPIEELGLDFILPGDGCTELRRGGRDIPVTAHNLNNYINLVTHWLLYEGVNRQMEAFREGFESVFPLANLKIFYPEELEQVFCGSASGGRDQRWDPRLLSECIRPDHGYTAESRAIRMLIDILASYSRDEQRLFLQFVTGSPRLPTGGFKALNPPLTVVRKSLESVLDPDEYLPSVMTCVNYLKLPDYSSAEVMRAKLRLAANEGQHSFHLS